MKQSRLWMLLSACLLVGLSHGCLVVDPDTGDDQDLGAPALDWPNITGGNVNISGNGTCS